MGTSLLADGLRRAGVRLAGVVLATSASGAAAVAQNVRLNPPFPRGIGGDVVAFQVDAEASRVVYLAEMLRRDP